MIRITKTGVERVDEPETLWKAVQEHHLSIGADTHVTRGRFAELQSLSVLPERRGEGLGTRVL